MLKNNQYNDLKWMYNFFNFVNRGVEVMFDSMRKYIQEVGTSFVLENKENTNVKKCIQVIYVVQILT